jgi:hypothetical protein
MVTMTDSKQAALDNGVRFISAFNAIEAWLRRRASDSQYRSFAKLVRNERGDRVVRRYVQDLLEYAELRNAITHAPSRPIAEPTNEAVADLEAIRVAIEHPPRLGSALGRRPVERCLATESIRDAAAKMHAGDF